MLSNNLFRNIDEKERNSNVDLLENNQSSLSSNLEDAMEIHLKELYVNKIK